MDFLLIIVIVIVIVLIVVALWLRNFLQTSWVVEYFSASIAPHVSIERLDRSPFQVANTRFGCYFPSPYFPKPDPEEIRRHKIEQREKLKRLLPPQGFLGKILKPNKVYEGDSKTIAISLEPTFAALKSASEELGVTLTQIEESFYIKSYGHCDFIELELLAAPLIVAGETKQRNSINLKKVFFHWNCYFLNSGLHTISIIVRQLKATYSVDIGELKYNIRVVKLDDLTRRQVSLITMFLGMAVGVATIIKVFL